MMNDFPDSGNTRSRRLAAPPDDPQEETSGKDPSERSSSSAGKNGTAARRRSQGEPAPGEDSSSGADHTASKPRRRPFRLEEYAAQVLSGNILTRAEVRRQYPYIFFMALLMLLYIANGYHIQKLHRRHDKLTAQIKELRSRSLTLSSIRMTATRQSEIIKELQARGIPLHESLVPPQVIDK